MFKYDQLGLGYLFLIHQCLAKYSFPEHTLCWHSHKRNTRTLTVFSIVPMYNMYNLTHVLVSVTCVLMSQLKLWILLVSLKIPLLKISFRKYLLHLIILILKYCAFYLIKPYADRFTLNTRNVDTWNTVNTHVMWTTARWRRSPRRKRSPRMRRSPRRRWYGGLKVQTSTPSELVAPINETLI